MTKIDISNNKLFAAGGKALAGALTGNQVLAELNLAANSLGLVKRDGDSDMSGVLTISNTIPTMGAMAKFTFSGMVGSREGPPVTVETSMTEADFSKKKLGASGAIMLAAFLPKCQ